MTRAFCALILHYAIIRLSWKTIKSLRRPRLSKSSDCNNSKGINPPQLEYEILKGWIIIAFHHIYVACHVEYLARCFIPFYFHMKMLALIATFVIPTRNAVGKLGGMSPIVNYIFDYGIVPGVQKVHSLMGNDPKSWAKLQLSLLPFVLVDWFILPGLLTSQEEIHVARERLRRDDDGRVLSKRKRNIIVNGYAMTMIIRPPEAFTHPIIANSNLSSDDDEPILQSGDLSSEPMDHSELSSVVKEKVMDTKSDDEFVEVSLIDEPSLQPNETRSEAMVINNERYRTTPPTISEAGVTGDEILRDLASVRERQDFVEKILNREDDARRRRRADRVSKHTVEKGGEITETPTRVVGSTFPVDLTSTDRSTSRDNFALFPRTTPTIVDRLSSRDHFDDLIINPDARRLLESTASKLKRFSPRLSPSNDVSYYEELHNDGGKYNNEVCKFSERQVDIEILRLSSLMKNKIEEQSTTRRQRVTEDGRRSRRCERLSLGDHLRELVTGDANIPIRDHLFDLDLTSTPEKKRGSKQSNVATAIHLALLPVMLPIKTNNTDVSMIRPLLPAWVDNSDESGGDPCISPTKISRPRQKHNANMQQQEKVLSPHVTTRRKSSRLAKKKDS